MSVPGFVLLGANQQMIDSISFPGVWLFCQEEVGQECVAHLEWHKAGSCVVEEDPQQVGGDRFSYQTRCVMPGVTS